MSRCYEQLLKKVSGKVLPDHCFDQTGATDKHVGNFPTDQLGFELPTIISTSDQHHLILETGAVLFLLPDLRSYPLCLIKLVIEFDEIRFLLVNI